MTEIMQQTQDLYASDLYTVVKVGRTWKFKTKHGIETFKTKKRAVEYAAEWKEAEKNV